MSLFILNNEIKFPPVHLAEPDGLLAIGGDLSQERLLHAYRNGIFPWYEGEHILWWSPDPRFVLYPEEFKLSGRIKKLLQQPAFRFTINYDFSAVIRHCKTVKRAGQEGTWITDEVEKAYTRLYANGYAHSAEVWQKDKLVGGLYGIRIGKVFFGESMFSLVTDASRYAFTCYVQQLIKEGVQLIDCQVYTSYLESMGARMIPRARFIQEIQNLVSR